MVIFKSKQKKFEGVTEMVIFKSKQKKFEGDLSGKRLYPTESVKYPGVKIDTNLSWQNHVNDLSVKLNRANALLFKMRKYVSCKILLLTPTYHTAALSRLRIVALFNE